MTLRSTRETLARYFETLAIKAATETLLPRFDDATSRLRSLHARLSKAGIEQLHVGIIGGASILVNERRWSNFDAISLAVRAHKDFPDARAAAKVIQALNRLKVLRKQAAPVGMPSRQEIYD